MSVYESGPVECIAKALQLARAGRDIEALAMLDLAADLMSTHRPSFLTKFAAHFNPSAGRFAVGVATVLILTYFALPPVMRVLSAAVDAIFGVAS